MKTCRHCDAKGKGTGWLKGVFYRKGENPWACPDCAAKLKAQADRLVAKIKEVCDSKRRSANEDL